VDKIHDIAQSTAVDIIDNTSSFDDFTLLLLGVLIGAGFMFWRFMKHLKHRRDKHE